MRTIVDIPDTQIRILENISKKHNISRAEVVRQALSSYIKGYIKNKDSYNAAFGIWKTHNKKLDIVNSVDFAY